GGVGVARGYQGLPTRTATSFVPDPFSGVPGARMYLTGDRVRWRADGTIDFVGRMDHQVKIRGFRIEPGEIEVVLLRHPEVAECAVVAVGGDGDRRLAAYVVGTAQPEALRAHLRQSLPEYMVPSAFVPLDALPVTSNGKLDRRALPAPVFGAETVEHVAPATPTEEILAGLYGEVLGLDRVSAEGGFFDLGGHSLIATRLISRVRAAFAVELPLRALFEAPAVRALAARVDALRREAAGTLAPPLVPTAREGALPLSFAQQRLWFIDQLQPGSAAYNVAHALRLRGRLDEGALERSLNEVVRRHETLRTRFPGAEGEPLQVIDPPAPVAVARVDLSAHETGEREARLRALAAAEARTPFDLAAGPLFRGTLVRLGDEEHAILFTLHHVISDGWSTAVLVREVSELYAAFTEDREPHLPELPVQYADYAAWQRGWLAGEVLEAQLAYWRTALSGAPPLLELPTDRPRPQALSDRGAMVPFTIPAETANALRGVSRREGATLFMTLLAAWQLLLSKYAGQDDVSVGTPIAGRTRLETEALIGFFVNTLVLRADLSGNPRFGELLRRVRAATLGGHEHQDVPFERLVEELAPGRALNHSPLFQAMFSLQNNERRALRLGALEAEPLPGGGHTAKFDLTLTLAEDGEEIAGALGYRTDLFDASTMRRMAAHFAALLGGVAEDADRPVGAYSLLDAGERRETVGEWNRTDAPYPSETTLHGMVEAQAARTPHAPALAFGGASLTYAELDAAANRLAHRLLTLGVRPEDRVGLCLEPSPGSVIGLLGIMKAGAAYLPVDAGAPDERIAFILDESGARVVVTDAAGASRPWAAARAAIRIDRVEELDGFPAGSPSISLNPRNLAYVLYTSGSTGLPKGVLVEHRGVCNAVHAFARMYETGPGARVLLFAPLHFDASVLDVFTALAAGATLVVAPREETMPGEPLAALLARERVTHAKFTPSAMAVTPA
ncbi:MAG: AMP-binding protein, partial [Gemmatimonadetes bacterium]|nr:AMP-binding protein [Gemmatimonadota bacterium]